MTDHPMLTFGAHKGKKLNHVPDDYILWLARPGREHPSEKYRTGLPLDIVTAARTLATKITETKEREQWVARIMGGHPTGRDTSVFVITSDESCYSQSGRNAIDDQSFDSLDEALAYMAEEFPMVPDEDMAGNPLPPRRLTPDPEDDRILIWEVTPDGFRRPVWGFFGWHWSADDFACGQGTLPGDEEDLYSIASRDC